MKAFAHLFLFNFRFLVLGLQFSSLSCSVSIVNETAQRKLADDPLCPFNVGKLRKMVKRSSAGLQFLDVATECYFLMQSIRIVRSDYLQTTGFFTIPSNASEACWHSFQILINEYLEAFDVRSNCGVQTQWISDSCMNVSTRSEFEALIGESDLQEVRRSCNQSLLDSSTCESCVASLLGLRAAYFLGPEIGNFSDCSGYPFIYAAAFANQFGPTDLGTTKCLFSIDFTPTARSKKHNIVLPGVVIGCVIGFLVAVVAVWLLQKRHMKHKKGKGDVANGLGLISGSTTLVRFTFEELKEATRNFSRENLIGRGGYGNVYRGLLADGSEVALKRFKNCSVSGGANFANEVEVIASINHVNLVALRGYCTAMDPSEGHQRILVCDLMRNGSLYDHLFESGANKLSWPIRRKIALGTAHGLAYLHNGARPAIIHRDVKASNILLDETFEPKLADFGLAKFTPDGLSHLSTKVAGTLGYVAPEYALYGQLTERSDVYSFGVVLLELLSGRKAVISVDGGQNFLLTDWAWSLVKEGRALDVIEDGMPELGPPEVMEKYVLVAVLSAHPLLYARPTVEQIVMILETDLPMVATIPDHPLSLSAEINEIERSLTCTESVFMFSTVDQQLFESDPDMMDHREGEETSLRRTM